MSAAPCRDGSGTHLFTIGADRCSICGWIRWPEVVDDAPMTAPEATPGRVPGVTGWWGHLDHATLDVGHYVLTVESPELFLGLPDKWRWRVRIGPKDIAGNKEPVMRTRAETTEHCAIRVRILAEQALEAHLVETLAALRGTP